MKRTLFLTVRVDLEDHALVDVLQKETGRDLRVNACQVAKLAGGYLGSVLSHIHCGPPPVVIVTESEVET